MQSNRHQNLESGVKILSTNNMQNALVNWMGLMGCHNPPPLPPPSLLPNEAKEVLQRILDETSCHEKLQGMMLVKVLKCKYYSVITTNNINTTNSVNTTVKCKYNSVIGV
jgi:hypothetical protein